jgi:glycosyltransferase involved in cell wall biosynthesis
VDLHVHSSFSNVPASWILRTLHVSECFTTPEVLYRTALLRGMNLVTVTDHDTIDGALELKGIADNTFISEEISAAFPEDGCVVHIVALDITEAHHREVQRLRSNIYELVAYLRQQSIAHVLSHPLSRVNQLLTASHVQRCLLMFDHLELINGTRSQVHETCLRAIIADLTPERIERWADQHAQIPLCNTTGTYGLVGGSDDHGHLAIARAYTSFVGPCSAAGLVKALETREVTPRGQNAKTAVIGHNAFGVLAGYLKSSGQLDTFLEGLAGTGAPAEPDPMAERVRTSFLTRFVSDEHSPQYDELVRRGHTDAYQQERLEEWTELLATLMSRALIRFGTAGGRGQLRGFCESLPDLVQTMLAGLPYLLGSRFHALDRRGARRFARELGFDVPLKRSPRVAVTTDSIDDVNGVAVGLRRLAHSARQQGLDLLLVGLGDSTRSWTLDQDNVARIPPVVTKRLSEYPQMVFGIPQLNALLNYLISADVDLIQCSTPGPMGIAGLIAGRLMGIPIIGQYHTDVPEYALRLTGDPVMGGIVGSFVGLFYRMMDQVLVPSAAMAHRVAALGVPADRIRQVPRGIDLELFLPGLRDAGAFEEFGVNGETKLLYVGRISKEKGLDSLLDNFRQVISRHPQACLILVGDGPYRSELADKHQDLVHDGKVVFAGEHTGEKLARIYASSDIFVFPSETETFGNAVVEAQASGLPVIVAQKGAAHENIQDSVTGMAVDVRRPEDLQGAMEELLTDEALRARMGRAAHEFAQRYTMTESTRRTFDTYTDFLDGSSRV